MSSKKVLIFSHEFPPDTGGVGVVAHQYAIEFTKMNYEVDILTSYKENKISIPKIDIIYNKIKNKFWFLGYKNIVNFNNYDVIFLNDPSAIYTAGIFFTKKQLDKSICFLHGSEPERIYDKPTLFRKLSLFKYFYNRTLFYSKVIISPSYFMKEKFLSSSKLLELQEKIKVVYYGVDSKLFTNSSSSLKRSDLGIGEKQEVLISVSRITKRKGYLDKYKIFKKLVKNNNKDLIWVIIGDGEYIEEFRNIIQNDNLEDRVLLLGKIERKKLVYYYNMSDLFWLCGIENESFGLVYIEAQMSGIAALGYNKAGTKEAIVDKKTGFLVDNINECIDIIEKQSYRNLNLNDILEFSNNFKISNSIEQIMEMNKCVE